MRTSGTVPGESGRDRTRYRTFAPSSSVLLSSGSSNPPEDLGQDRRYRQVHVGYRDRRCEPADRHLGGQLKTDKDGHHALWLDVRNNPLRVIVAKDGYQPQVRKVKIVKGTTTADFSLNPAP